MPKISEKTAHSLGDLHVERSRMQKAMVDRTEMVFAATPTTDSSSAGTVYKPTKAFTVRLQDSDGNVHTWFQAKKVTVATFGTQLAHAATVRANPATLEFTDGVSNTMTHQTGGGATAATWNSGNVMGFKVKAFKVLGHTIATKVPAGKYYLKT